MNRDAVQLRETDNAAMSKKPFQHWIKYRSKLHTIACLPVTVHNGVCDMLIAKRPGLETF